MGKTPESIYPNQRNNYEVLMQGFRQEFRVVEALTDPVSKRQALERLWKKLGDQVAVPIKIQTNLSYLRKVPENMRSKFVDYELQKLAAFTSEDRVKAYEYQIMINNALAEIHK